MSAVRGCAGLVLRVLFRVQCEKRPATSSTTRPSPAAAGCRLSATPPYPGRGVRRTARPATGDQDQRRAWSASSKVKDATGAERPTTPSAPSGATQRWRGASARGDNLVGQVGRQRVVGFWLLAALVEMLSSGCSRVTTSPPVSHPSPRVRDPDRAPDLPDVPPQLSSCAAASPSRPSRRPSAAVRSPPPRRCGPTCGDPRRRLPHRPPSRAPVPTGGRSRRLRRRRPAPPRPPPLVGMVPAHPADPPALLPPGRPPLPCTWTARWSRSKAVLARATPSPAVTFLSVLRVDGVGPGPRWHLSGLARTRPCQVVAGRPRVRRSPRGEPDGRGRRGPCQGVGRRGWGGPPLTRPP